MKLRYARMLILAAVTNSTRRLQQLNTVTFTAVSVMPTTVTL